MNAITHGLVANHDFPITSSGFHTIDTNHGMNKERISNGEQKHVGFIGRLQTLPGRGYNMYNMYI